VLSGTKRWITNAGVSKYYTVMAVTDPSAGPNGISAFVVDKDDEGFSFGAPEHKLGIKGSPTRELYFDNCRIPAGRIIGAEGSGFKTALATLDHTRITIAAQALGIAQGALDYAIGYVKERKQFGKAIAEFQGLQFMLAAGNARRARRRSHLHLLGLQMLRLGRGNGRHYRCGPATRRLRLCQ
jgi:alkylation response protein AidB-like acyl-CoA dehydrogenase